MIRRKRQINLLVPNYRSFMVDQKLISTFSFEGKVIQDNGGAISANHCQGCGLSKASGLVAPDRKQLLLCCISVYVSMCIVCVCILYVYVFVLCAVLGVWCVWCLGVSCILYV